MSAARQAGSPVVKRLIRLGQVPRTEANSIAIGLIGREIPQSSYPTIKKKHFLFAETLGNGIACIENIIDELLVECHTAVIDTALNETQIQSQAQFMFKLFVSALTCISIDQQNPIPTTDNRLIRRIIRDYNYRGYSAQETISRWPSVRRGENRNIFPFQENADAMFNTSLICEMGVLKQYAIPILAAVPENCVEFAEAYRLLKFLTYFKMIPENNIPGTSILREFVGGSKFNY